MREVPATNHVSIVKVGSLTCLIITKDAIGAVLDDDPQAVRLSDTDVEADFQTLTGKVKSKAEIEAKFKASLTLVDYGHN